MQILYLVLLVLLCVWYKVTGRTGERRPSKDLAYVAACRSPKNITGGGILSVINGWLKLWRMITMLRARKDILDDFFAPSFDGVHTIQETSFDGSVVIPTTEPDNMHAMLSTQFEDFEIGQLRVNQFYPLLGNSIFSSDGSSWKHSRKLFRPQFDKKSINDIESTDRACRALICVIGSTDSHGWTDHVELLPLFNKFTLDTATAFLFGESIQSLGLVKTSSARDAASRSTSRQARSEQFQEDFEMASSYLLKRIRYQSMYWIADGLDFRRAVGRLHEFIGYFVQRAITLTSKSTPAATYDLLSTLVTETQDPKELRDQTMAILAAARDTTASFLSWCLVRLALHPRIFHELRSTVLQQFGREPESITVSRLTSCSYLQHFLREVLRLHPTVPVNNRRARVDTTLPVGGGPDQKSPIAVARGQVVIYSVYLMHRRQDLWGHNASVFEPERWADQTSARLFLPFSAGPRACLGQEFALMEAAYVLVRLLQQFDAIEPFDKLEMERMRKGLGLTMWPADQVKVRFHKA